jgi:magnesium chelatase subunit D
MNARVPQPGPAAAPGWLTAALFAVDPAGLGGVSLRCAAGPQRDAWLGTLAALLPTGAPWRRVPLHINDDRLLGGLDLSATLQAGRPVAQRGLLAEADGGVLVLAMAERLAASTAASIAAVLDTRELVVERHGVGARSASRLGVVALDEGLDDDERLPACLRERLAFLLMPDHIAFGPNDGAPACTRADVAAARARLAGVRVADAIVEALCACALALGIDSVRAPMLACRAARAAAALDGRSEVSAQDAALAAGLVLAPRATRLPASGRPSDEAEDALEEPPPPASSNQADANDLEASTGSGPVEDVVLDAALAAIPAGLLTALAIGRNRTSRARTAGRAGAAGAGTKRGRPIGSRRGEPHGGARLNVIETLRAAAPWQALRRREAASPGHAGGGSRPAKEQAERGAHQQRGGRPARAQAEPEATGGRAGAGVQVRREDFRVWRFKQRSETTTLFVVDASGSAALHRLAETKGAVELLLADCYVRRDSVAVIAFRGQGAELLLPPTRSLVRAKRSLAGLPGGGGTPLAAGIESAGVLAGAIRRRGATPVVVLLTDGRANIARDGTPGRARASEDAMAAARHVRVEGFPTLLLDTSPQPQESACRLAAEMGARYLPLPHAGAGALSHAVRTAGAPSPAVR